MLLNTLFFFSSKYSSWIDFSEPNIPSHPTLEVITKQVTPISARFDFKLTGPDHMTIFIGTKNDAVLRSWTFNDTVIRQKWEQPYFIYFSYGIDPSPLEFFIEVEVIQKRHSNMFNKF